jgi:hypothetical protein
MAHPLGPSGAKVERPGSRLAHESLGASLTTAKALKDRSRALLDLAELKGPAITSVQMWKARSQRSDENSGLMW